MNKTAWHMMLALGSVAAIATACTVSSGGSDDDEQTTTRGGPTGATGGTSGDGGSGGEVSSSTTGGTTTDAGGAAGESSGGTGGTGGSGGSGGGEIECLDVDDPSGDPAPTENLDPDANSCCILCAAQNCPDQVADCYATGPENICGVKNGEIQLIQDCMLENEGLPGFGDDSDFIGCVAEAANGASGPLCGLGTISGTTNDFAVCLHGDESGVGGCFEECFTDFVDDACVYRD